MSYTSSLSIASSASRDSGYSLSVEGWVSQSTSEVLKPVLDGSPHSKRVQTVSLV